VRWAREQEPVFYSPQLGYWVVTRFDDIKAVFRDNITFSPRSRWRRSRPRARRPMPCWPPTASR
jgi:cytochrome P450